MSTLNTAPVNAILDRLYAAAACGSGPSRLRYMAVPPQTGRLLYVLARFRRARVIVEFGASFGVSTLHLAAALRDSGGGQLVTTEYQPNKVAATRLTLAEAGLGDLVEVREGDARKTLANSLPGPVDLLFLDGAKQMYLEVLGLLLPKLAPGAVVFADNADSPDAADYRDYVRTDPAWLSTAPTERTEISVYAG